MPPHPVFVLPPEADEVGPLPMGEGPLGRESRPSG